MDIIKQKKLFSYCILFFAKNSLCVFITINIFMHGIHVYVCYFNIHSAVSYILRASLLASRERERESCKNTRLQISVCQPIVCLSFHPVCIYYSQDVLPYLCLPSCSSSLLVGQTCKECLSVCCLVLMGGRDNKNDSFINSVLSLSLTISPSFSLSI